MLNNLIFNCEFDSEEKTKPFIRTFIFSSSLDNPTDGIVVVEISLFFVKKRIIRYLNIIRK